MGRSTTLARMDTVVRSDAKEVVEGKERRRERNKGGGSKGRGSEEQAGRRTRERDTGGGLGGEIRAAASWQPAAGVAETQSMDKLD